MGEVRFRLSPKQHAAISSKADLVVYGGGNGGGKTCALRMLPLQAEYLKTPGVQCVLFAETDRKLEQAGGLVDKCKEFYSTIHPRGLDGFRASPRKRWTFPTNHGTSTIDLSYVGEADQWDGLEAVVICIDQVEQVTEDQFWSVCGRNRTSTSARCRKFVTANPPRTDLKGGPGRDHWLTRMIYRGGWIDDDGYPIEERSGKVRYFCRDADSGEVVFGDTPEDLDSYLPIDPPTGKKIAPQTMTFIGALIGDHPDPVFREKYLRELAQLPLAEQARRRLGNWFVSEDAGKYFQSSMFPVVEWSPDPRWRPRRMIRAWDNAWSTAEKADRTPGVLLSLWPDNSFLVFDLIAIRGTYSHVERLIELTALEDRRWAHANGLPEPEIRLPKDAGAAGGLQSAIAQRLGARGFVVKLTADRGDKFTRSKGYQGCAERKQIKLAKLHLSAGVAVQMGDNFTQYDRSGNIVVVTGLPEANILTLRGWHEVFLLEHVNFGLNTVAKRNIKKDTVDACVGAYELITEVPDLSWRTTDPGLQSPALEALVNDFGADFFRPEKGIC